MQPNQNQPVQPQSGSLDFTQQPIQQPVQPVQQPVAPIDVPAFRRELVQDVVTALQANQPAPVEPVTPVEPAPQQKSYGEWGEVFSDVESLLDKKLQEREQQAQQAQVIASQQDQKNQQIIESTLNDLRSANYLPPVTNKLDANDPGKQAEMELIGYAVNMQTTDLVKAAEELKFRHEQGFKFDRQTNQFVQVSNPHQQEGPSMFGNMPVTPDQPLQQQAPQMQPYPQYPQQMMQPYGPQNPYVSQVQQYPPGFNAPVSTGGSFMGMGMQGQTPTPSTYRHASYDQLVDMFNRTN